MSYSRWSYSKWYTFYNTNDLFEICGEAEFSYTDLKNNRQKCLDKIQKQTDATDNEIKELNEYMNWFIEDYENRVYRMETHSFD